jgi:P27 family predicted phage terminase small subunit
MAKGKDDSFGPPADLAAEAHALWRETIAALQERGLPVDLFGVRALCEAWMLAEDAREVVRTEGMTARGDRGGAIQHPAQRVRDRATDRLLKIRRDLCLTQPAPRAAQPAPAAVAGWRGMKRADWEALPWEEARKLYLEEAAPGLDALFKSESLPQADAIAYVATLAPDLRDGILSGEIAAARLAVPDALTLGRNPRRSGSPSRGLSTLTIRLDDLTWVDREYRADQDPNDVKAPGGRFVRGETEVRAAAKAPASDEEELALRGLGLRVAKRKPATSKRTRKPSTA